MFWKSAQPYNRLWWNCFCFIDDIVPASRAFVYTNAILLCKMLVGLCPNPICSASCRCRLRVFSKRFYLYMVEFQDSCALQFWWRHLKPNEQPATASTVSEVMMLAVLRSERKTFDIFAGSWYTTSNTWATLLTNTWATCGVRSIQTKKPPEGGEDKSTSYSSESHSLNRPMPSVMAVAPKKRTKQINSAASRMKNWSQVWR